METIQESKCFRRFAKDADATLQVIEKRELLGNEVTVYGTPEQPLFLAKDVAEWIEHSNVTMMLDKVDEDEKVKLNNTYFENRTGGNGTFFLTEDGLYEVLMQSRKPIAKEFKREVKAILKQIRQTGGYIPVAPEDTEQEILSKALLIMQNTLEKKDQLLKQQQQVLEQQAPLAEFGQALAKSSTSILVRELAKIISQATDIQLGEKKLYTWLRQNAYIMQNSTEPYQRRVEQGIFELKANGTFTRSDGTTHTSYTTYVTAKGQQHILDKFKSALCC